VGGPRGEQARVSTTQYRPGGGGYNMTRNQCSARKKEFSQGEKVGPAVTKGVGGVQQKKNCRGV